MCSSAPGHNERIQWSVCLALCCIFQQVTSLHFGTVEISHLLLAWNAGNILYSWFHPTLPCFLPFFLLHLEMPVLISQAVPGFPITAPNRINLNLLPLASPLSFILVYDQKILKCSHPHHCLLLASQSSQTLIPKSLLSYSHLSLFFFYLTAYLYHISPLNSLSLPFPVKPAITSSFLSLFLFLPAWTWSPPSTPVYF